MGGIDLRSVNIESRAALVVSTQRERWTPALKWTRSQSQQSPAPGPVWGERDKEVKGQQGILAHTSGTMIA